MVGGWRESVYSTVPASTDAGINRGNNVSNVLIFMAYTPTWIESTQGAITCSEIQQRSLYWIAIIFFESQLFIISIKKSKKIAAQNLSLFV